MYDEQETNFVIYEGVVVPESALIRPIRQDKYGKVPGLPEEELASPDELERQVLREEMGPVLQLPVKQPRSDIRLAVDENGGIDWGAFGTVDFDSHRPEFDKIRYKADKLREERKNALIMFAIVRQRIPGRAKYEVLKQLNMGIIELEHIENDDILALAKYHLRAERLKQEIDKLEEAGRARQAKQVEAWLKA